MWDIDDKERRSLAKSLSSSDQPGSSLNTLGDCLLDAEIKEKYSELKKRVKEETVQAILKLNAKSPSPPKQSHHQNSLSPQQHGSSSSQQHASCSPKQRAKTTRVGKNPKKTTTAVLDSKATDILNKWFDDHSDKPYPTKQEKEELARRCKMSIKQLSTWFNNKRYRSNCTLTKKGKGKGKGSK